MGSLKYLLVAVLLLLIVNISLNVYLLMELRKSSVSGLDAHSGGKASLGDRGILSLRPPPDIAVNGPVVTSDGNVSIPPLNTSDIYVIAYYNAGQEINLTKAAGLQGLSVNKWGFSYFDATYYFHDPQGLPVGTEAYENSTIVIQTRVRSDGWILAWIWKNQSLSTIVMTGWSIGDIGNKDPWISLNITTLSYTIYKILVQAGIVGSDDSNGDGVPDALVSISQNVGYYDYKYCGSTGKIGFLAVVGVRNALSYSGLVGVNKWSNKLFDLLIGGAFEIKEYILMINWRIGAYDNWGSAGDDCGEVYFDFGNTSSPPQIYYSGAKCSGEWWKWYYMVRLDIRNFNLTTNTVYYAKLRLHLWCSYSYDRAVDVRAETFIIMIGVLRD